MAKAKTDEPKQLLEREYIVPLRKGWLKVPKYKRANKAVKTLKEFIARHMKIYDSDLRKVKIDIILNNELRFRGMKKPPAKIKVKAIKFDDGIVRVELVDVPEHIKFARLREEKSKKVEVKKKVEEKVEKKTEEEKKEKSDEEVTDKEKKEETKNLEDTKTKKEEKKVVKETKPKTKVKQASKDKGVKIQRKALAR